MVNPDGVRHQVRQRHQSTSRVPRCATFDRGVTSLEWVATRSSASPNCCGIDVLLLDRPEQPPMGAGESASVAPRPSPMRSSRRYRARLRQVPFTPGTRTRGAAQRAGLILFPGRRGTSQMADQIEGQHASASWASSSLVALARHRPRLRGRPSRHWALPVPSAPSGHPTADSRPQHSRGLPHSRRRPRSAGGRALTDQVRDDLQQPAHAGSRERIGGWSYPPSGGPCGIGVAPRTAL